VLFGGCWNRFVVLLGTCLQTLGSFQVGLMCFAMSFGSCKVISSLGMN